MEWTTLGNTGFFLLILIAWWGVVKDFDTTKSMEGGPIGPTGIVCITLVFIASLYYHHNS